MATDSVWRVAVTRLQQLGIDQLPPAERVALARELLVSVAAATPAPAAPPAITDAELRRAAIPPPVPVDEWERALFSAAIDCGVSVPDAALSSDGLYD
jgi:hypothetical protein